MAEPHTLSIPTLVRELIADARELIREELALLRAEAREQTGEAKGIGLLFGGALVLALVGIVLLFVAVAAAAAELFGISMWVSFGVLALLAAGAAYVLQGQGRKQLATLKVLPKTRASVQENIAWIQTKSNRG
jgi:hypothetical protein